jgi:hypothetical protein
MDTVGTILFECCCCSFFIPTMSDLEKRLMQKKIIGGLSAQQEEVGNLSQILEETPTASSNLPPTSVSNRNKHRAVDCTQLPWTDFFDQKQNVQVGDDTFNVYIKGDSGPVFYLLHGAGYSGLTWSCFAVIVRVVFYLNNI